jgi:hypothetical protein
MCENVGHSPWLPKVQRYRRYARRLHVLETGPIDDMIGDIRQQSQRTIFRGGVC